MKYKSAIQFSPFNTSDKILKFITLMRYLGLTTLTFRKNTTQSKGMARRVARGPRGVRGEIRSRLMEVAREQFSTREFNSVTVRGIAEEAGVDPSLVSYYFGGKSGLLRAAMSLPADPVAAALKEMTPLEGAGSRVFRVILNLWEETNANHAARVLIHQLLSSEETMYVFRTWIDESVVTPVSKMLGGPDRRLRAASGVGLIIGALLNRYIAGIEPVASASIEDSAAFYSVCLQYLFTPEIFPSDFPAIESSVPPMPSSFEKQTLSPSPSASPASSSSQNPQHPQEPTPPQGLAPHPHRSTPSAHEPGPRQLPQTFQERIPREDLTLPEDPSFPQDPRSWPF